MVASSSGSIDTSGKLPGSASAITLAQVVTPPGAVRSLRTEMMCIGRCAGMWFRRSRRSSSAISTSGSLSFSAYSISGAVHQAFMPTTAAPALTMAQ